MLDDPEIRGPATSGVERLIASARFEAPWLATERWLRPSPRRSPRLPDQHVTGDLADDEHPQAKQQVLDGG